MNRAVSLVLGYVQRIDRLPRAASDYSLSCRFAVALDSFRPGLLDMFFDVELYVALMEAIAVDMRADTVLLRVAKGAPLLNIATDQLKASLIEGARTTGEPVEEIWLLSGNTRRALLISEPWTQHGGPQQYHDRYVVAVFTQEDHAEALKNACAGTVAACGGVIDQIVHGSVRSTILRDRIRAGLRAVSQCMTGKPRGQI